MPNIKKKHYLCRKIKNIMTTKRYYKVAGHVMALTADDGIFAMLDNCRPFEVEAGDALLEMDIHRDMPMPEGWTEEWRQEEEGDEIACGHVGDNPAFVFISRGKTAGWLLCSSDYRKATVSLTGIARLALDNAMMVGFALATARMDTLLFHSSVVNLNGKAYMFLGPSGTGKSTHTGLWQKYVEGSQLLNDDNPVVRLSSEGVPVVYGSPWSGKTPCYKNEQYPLGAIVGLAQAPYNAIRRMVPIEAYATLSSSVSGKRWDRNVADGLHNTLNALTSKTAVWRMECLPDEAAAIMTSTTI